jgi:S1-C subfamily serine protease
LLVLEQAFQEAIRKAEPSIACILVSRSEAYRRWFGETANPEFPGKLGGFDPLRAELREPPEDRQQLEELKKELQRRFNLREEIARDRLKRFFDLADPSNVPDSFGSGVVLDERGLILTNYHVVRDAVKIFVRLPGDKGSYCDIHAADPRSDLAMLRVLDRAILPLKALPRGDAAKLKKGSLVLSLANPFAAGHRDGSPSASWGIVSNVRRRAPGPVEWESDRAKLTLHHFGTLLQTDARLNLGCSGGALVDLDGQLVGITTSLAALAGGESAGGFAVPLDAAMRRIIDVLEKGEEVEFGFLGVGLGQDDRRGEVRLSSVMPGSAAARAGLRSGDLVLAIDQTPIKDNDDLLLAVGSRLAGSRIQVEVRNSAGTRRLVDVTLDKFYLPSRVIAANRPGPVRGMRVDYTSILVQRDRFRQDVPSGVFVREVVPGSPAEQARLQDAIVTHVNGQAVTTPAEFYQLAGRISGGLELTLLGRDESGLARKVKLE